LQTEWLKQQISISDSSGGWEVQDDGAADPESAEATFPGLQMVVFSLYAHKMESSDREAASSLMPLLP
jgi:hypothetical protein